MQKQLYYIILEFEGDLIRGQVVEMSLIARVCVCVYAPAVALLIRSLSLTCFLTEHNLVGSDAYLVSLIIFSHDVMQCQFLCPISNYHSGKAFHWIKISPILATFLD